MKSRVLYSTILAGKKGSTVFPRTTSSGNIRSTTLKGSNRRSEERCRLLLLELQKTWLVFPSIRQDRHLLQSTDRGGPSHCFRSSAKIRMRCLSFGKTTRRFGKRKKSIILRERGARSISRSTKGGSILRNGSGRNSFTPCEEILRYEAQHIRGLNTAIGFRLSSQEEPIR